MPGNQPSTNPRRGPIDRFTIQMSESQKNQQRQRWNEELREHQAELATRKAILAENRRQKVQKQVRERVKRFRKKVKKAKTRSKVFILALFSTNYLIYISLPNHLHRNLKNLTSNLRKADSVPIFQLRALLISQATPKTTLRALMSLTHTQN